MFRVGLSTCGAATEEVFSQYHDSGIPLMELSLPKEHCIENDHEVYARLARTYGITLWSYHLPFGISRGIDISHPELQAESVQLLSEVVQKASAIGIKTMVIHPSGEPIEETERRERMERAKESLSKLSAVAVSCGSVIAVEDLPRTCLGRDSADMLDLLSADEALRTCFDTNHLLYENNVDFIKKIGKKIVTTHVSDYDFVDEKHWLPGEGQNDWNAILDALTAIGYEGPWMYEIGMGSPKIITRERDLCHSDFVRNAKELFARQKPTTFIKA